MNRKRIRILLVLMICAVLLTGCGEKTLRGEVMEVTSDGQLSFVLDQRIGDCVTIKTNEDTHIFSWIDEVTQADFRKGNVEGIIVSVTGRKNSDGWTASQVQIEQLRIRDYYTLDDGTKADLIIGLNENIYCLGDITELLRVRRPVGPDHVQVAGQESLDDLNEEAQQNIIAYYDAQGLFYDELQTLEEAYDEYYYSDKFYAYYLSQEITPTASSDDVIYFLTYFMSDKVREGSEELRLGAAFDKKTGEVIPVTDLFACKPEEIITKLIEICDLKDKDPVAEMKEAFKPEYIVFFPECIEIIFPESAMPEYGLDFGMSIDYKNEALQELLQPWAIPNKEAKR